LSTALTLLADNHYVDGMDRVTFERAVEHVMCSRFGYDNTIAELTTTTALPS